MTDGILKEIIRDFEYVIGQDGDETLTDYEKRKLNVYMGTRDLIHAMLNTFDKDHSINPIDFASTFHLILWKTDAGAYEVEITYNKDQLISSLEEAFEILTHAKPETQGLPPVLYGGERYMSRLSVRERQVIDLVYQGETNKSIGIQLGISIKTVEKHRGKAMKKMEVSSLAELIRLMDREQGR